MPMNALNGTRPKSPYTNGLTTANNSAKSKSISSENFRSFPSKEKRKEIYVEEFKNRLGLSNEGISKGSDKSEIINPQMNRFEKTASNVTQTSASNYINSLSVDKRMRLNGNPSDPSNDLTNNSSNLSSNKQRENRNNRNKDLLPKSNSNLMNAKRELDQEIEPQEPASSKKLKTENVSVSRTFWEPNWTINYVMLIQSIFQNQIELKEAPFVAAASTMTEPEFLGFAEPGTSVVLEGAVLDEIEGN